MRFVCPFCLSKLTKISKEVYLCKKCREKFIDGGDELIHLNEFIEEVEDECEFDDTLDYLDEDEDW